MMKIPWLFASVGSKPPPKAPGFATCKGGEGVPYEENVFSGRKGCKAQANDHLTNQRVPAKLLERRAGVSLSPEDYLSSIGHAMVDKQRPVTVDCSFMMQYGLVAENNPEELIVGALSQLIKG
jgi:hypothetical protein